jgi:lysozyme
MHYPNLSILFRSEPITRLQRSRISLESNLGRCPGLLHSAPLALMMFIVRTRLLLIGFVVVWSSFSIGAQSSEFTEPWKNPNVALAIDPFEGNEIDWDELATDKRVVAIIHRATIGDRADKKYAERKIEAKRRGYKWGAYHFGKPGDPVKQADFFLETVKPEANDLLALDLESTDATKHMSFDEARIFIKRIKEKTGRYMLIYANNVVTKALSEQFGADDVFAKTPLWYARFKAKVDDFPKGTWDSYTLWQFSSEINCRADNRSACLYTVAGTAYDMDVNVFNGTPVELRQKWPFGQPAVN